MEVKTYRARSMQDALQLVRVDLGPDAAVLHTREVRRGVLGWLSGRREIEVTASASVHVPSRLAAAPAAGPAAATSDRRPIPPADQLDYRSKFRDDLSHQLNDLHTMLEDLCQRNEPTGNGELPEVLFRLFADLLDAEIDEQLARQLIDRLQAGALPGDLQDPLLLKARIARMVEDDVQVTGPLQVQAGAQRRVVLVGPTGVGKTTTIAKLAANFRLRDDRRVGLITVDTYRIAAVDQLRTYADIIDLPMEVVSTPREMRQAVERLSDLDLLLVDTAGRSPRDEIRIQELKSLLGEARADEVHLVLSCVASVCNLKQTAARFQQVGATALVLTKLDEATGFGNLLPLLRDCRLPVSYVTNGQNVPDDIAAATRRRLAEMVLGTEGDGSRHV